MKNALGAGFKHNEHGEWEMALAQFEQVLTVDDTSSAAWYGKGYAYYLKGDHALSTDAYSRALTLDQGASSHKMSRPQSTSVDN